MWHLLYDKRGELAHMVLYNRKSAECNETCRIDESLKQINSSHKYRSPVN